MGLFDYIKKIIYLCNLQQPSKTINTSIVDHDNNKVSYGGESTHQKEKQLSYPKDYQEIKKVFENDQNDPWRKKVIEAEETRRLIAIYHVIEEQERSLRRRQGYMLSDQQKKEIKEKVFEEYKNTTSDRDVLRIRLNSIPSQPSAQNKKTAPQSRHVPQKVKKIVMTRDGRRCVKCGAREYLEFDHKIPFSKGGSNQKANIQILCRKCNLKKGSNI